MSKYFTDWAKQFKSGGLVGGQKKLDKNKDGKISAELRQKAQMEVYMDPASTLYIEHLLNAKRKET